MINEIRKILIRVGKTLPFIICFLACLNYAETAFALLVSDYLDLGGIIIPNISISFFIGLYFEYNIQTLVVISVISISIQTCIWNKIACIYLGINLIEKSYFQTIELFPEEIYIICFANIIISAFLIYKGLKML